MCAEGGRHVTKERNDAQKDRAGKRPAPATAEPNSDVMQAALQVDGYVRSRGTDAHLLQMADDADPPASVTKDGEPEDDAHDYDDVVQQSFPASDPPPPR